MWALMTILLLSCVLFFVIMIWNWRLSKQIDQLKQWASQGDSRSMFDLGDIAAAKALPALADHWYAKGIEASGTAPLIFRAEQDDKRGLGEVAEMQLRSAVQFDCTYAKQALSKFYRDKCVNWNESLSLLESAALDGDAACQYEYAALLTESLQSGWCPADAQIVEKKARHFFDLAHFQKYQPEQRLFDKRTDKKKDRRVGKRAGTKALFEGERIQPQRLPVGSTIRINFGAST